MVYIHIFTYIQLILMVNVGKCTIHGSYEIYFEARFLGQSTHAVFFFNGIQWVNGVSWFP